MYGSILSVLLMGMIPVWGGSGVAPVSPRHIVVAAPTSLSEVQQRLSEIAPSLSASGILVIDTRSGQTVFESHAQDPRPMASLTKLMTALIIVENHGLDEWVTVPREAKSMEGSSARLAAGESFTVGDLLTGLLVPSGNDAALTLALYHSGSVEVFVSEMNRRARELGLKGTSYENPTGLDSAAQLSTPRDLAWLTMYVLRHPAIAERLRLKTATIESKEGTRLSLTHTHLLLHSPAMIAAGKTGTTDAAGQCLLSIVEYEGRSLAVILLGSGDRYGDMRRTLTAFQP